MGEARKLRLNITYMKEEGESVAQTHTNMTNGR